MVSERSPECVVSEGYPSITSDEHLTWILIWVLLDVGDELHDGTSHEVRFIDLVSVTDGGHVFLEGQRHPQAGLVRVFGHRHFLSSFWILAIIRLTVSRIRFSFDLLVRGLFVRPHKGLVSGSCWLFFIGFTPVQQSLQEYLGVLVDDPVRWISSNILKGIPDGIGLNWMSWGSDFWTYWTYYRNSMSILSPVTSETYPIRETIPTKCYHAYGHQVGWAIRYPLHSHHRGLPNPCEVFLYLNCGHDMKPIGWWSYRVRVKSSLVLLEMFSHPIQLWCSPIPICKVHWGNPSSGLGNLSCPSI